jgi:hypothetical protein
LRLLKSAFAGWLTVLFFEQTGAKDTLIYGYAAPAVIILGMVREFRGR